MKKSFIHINGIKYDYQEIFVMVLDLLLLKSSPPEWKVKGLLFISELLDPHVSSFQFNTSGTTGDPKEIFFSKKQILYSAENTCQFFGLSASSKLFLCLPADFVAGRMMIARAFYVGADLMWVEPTLNPLKDIDPLVINFAAFTPAQVANIINDPLTCALFESIEKVIIGGGEMSNVLENELIEFRNQIFVTYGMTETLTHIAVRKIGEQIYHSIYKDCTFSVDENNCLCIELPFISNERIITKDLVELINHQSFVWKGRLDNVINTGGIKLYAEEIEKKLLKAELLKEGTFYISSHQDNIFGQVPVIVLLNATIDIEVAELLTTINQLLNKHELIKHVLFFDKFEYTKTGKLKRARF